MATESNIETCAVTDGEMGVEACDDQLEVDELKTKLSDACVDIAAGESKVANTGQTEQLATHKKSPC